ncbi:ABC transporter ATP-binding protein [Frankia sp. AgKG'84/4]
MSAEAGPVEAGPAEARPARPRPILEVDGLEVFYGSGRRRRRVLRDVSLSVSRGEVLGVIGETGSGKSTFARAVLGLVRAGGGRIVLDGEDVTRLRARRWRDLRRRGVVQYVFQDPLRSLDPDVTVGDSLIEPLLVRGRVSRAGALDAAREHLRRVNLDPDLLTRLPGELSGGQRQRVAVARALITEPALIILDEPVSALDSANRVGVLEILKGLRDAGVALVFISHDLGSVAGVADRIAVLYQGEIVEVDAARTVVASPRHPYTRLLVGSAPTLRPGTAAGGRAGRAEREALRALLPA